MFDTLEMNKGKFTQLIAHTIGTSAETPDGEKLVQFCIQLWRAFEGDLRNSIIESQWNDRPHVYINFIADAAEKFPLSENVKEYKRLRRELIAAAENAVDNEIFEMFGKYCLSNAE